MFPQRVKGTLTVTILAPDRIAVIKSALSRYTISAFDAAKARDELKALKPTAAEISAVFTTP